MNTTNDHTLQLIAKFLNGRFAEFQYFLQANEIEASEAEVIINDLRKCFFMNPERPVIDRKFIISAYNPVTFKTYSSHDAILLCAKDAAVLAALQAYQAECMRIGANPEHVESIGLLIGRVEDYQRQIESRVPDTIGAEIGRCLFGAGVN